MNLKTDPFRIPLNIVNQWNFNQITLRARQGNSGGGGSQPEENFWAWEDGTEMRWEDDTAILTEDN